jgi:hypothetical protein
MYGVLWDRTITKRDLLKAESMGLRRLARYIKLKNTDQMSDRQVAKLIFWRITRPDIGRMY